MSDPPIGPHLVAGHCHRQLSARAGESRVRVRYSNQESRLRSHYHPANLPPPRGKPVPKPWHEVEELNAKAMLDDNRDNLGQADLHPLTCTSVPSAPPSVSSAITGGRSGSLPTRTAGEAPFLVTPADALQVARREVSRHHALETSREWASNPADAATKFYALAKDATENDILIFDEANLLARAIGVSLEKNDATMKRIVSFKGDKVSLISACDRRPPAASARTSRTAPGWTPATS